MAAQIVSTDTESAIAMEATATVAGCVVPMKLEGHDMKIVQVVTAIVEAVVHMSMTGGVRGRARHTEHV